MRSQGSHGRFCRVPLELGAREWAGEAKRSQGGPRCARISPKGEGKPGKARGAMASSVEFRWDLEPGGGQVKPREARDRQDEGPPRCARISPKGEGKPGGALRVLLSSAGTWSQGVGKRSQEMPGRANMGQDGPKRGGGARQSHEEPGEPWRVLSSSAGTWSQGVGR